MTGTNEYRATSSSTELSTSPSHGTDGETTLLEGDVAYIASGPPRTSAETAELASLTVTINETAELASLTVTINESAELASLTVTINETAEIQRHQLQHC